MTREIDTWRDTTHLRRSSTAEITSRAGYHLADFSLIALTTHTLTGQWLHDLFLKLQYFRAAPSQETQQTWLDFPILGAALFFALALKIANYVYTRKQNGRYLAAQEYFHALFSGVYGLFIAESLGVPETMENFIGTSAVFVPLIALACFKITVPDSMDKLDFSLIDPDDATYSFPTALKKERYLNSFFKCITSLAALSTFLWAANREIAGKTVSLPDWEKGLLLLSIPVAGKIGYELTMHPKFYRGYRKTQECVKSAALVYAALSSICHLAIVYHDENREMQMSDTTRALLSYTCFCLSLMMGIFAAAKTGFDFQENHDGNVKLLTGWNRFWLWANQKIEAWRHPDAHATARMMATVEV
ncbi:MAG: hypothetical protein A3I77_07045 [Gammaproteobacteria bacterium RIFCSPLOWO2_02_FULL_42_14]|nr:MAG: hypothetical protein A3B71_02880 [Gammaproteobacteria bacterium RIFCSPHIGHO2_02_FULL_42_43]OGT27656.1 MAG: hypothetical protein A2624_04525 [Gammaproteobacteria bacterium RIFCSPHIGHO2_01_FULL_42_8]OGT52012.1 MAG: hypothetical protein A3E54_04385 [Gammaproteobacteria bacterium RIFCSPHIGHO2_12_FULL_41_25]OGT61117.1 MAG: hypothetical protein A3I77_07045 [Gammaproteobacteria bacterium RIFCSPLOWO2_02_FULL_42_14]OGT87045.1 MAG: hypothetical protein A3G86_00765 [Gammaproteobacteria bacterium R